MIYLDTSAFLKLYIREADSKLVAECVESQDEPLPVWDLLEAELINALRLKTFWGDITPEQADGQIELFAARKKRGLYFVPDIDRIALMDNFRDLCANTPRLGCRTMDIMHVACAKRLAAQMFITFDERQRKLARTAGLAVFPESKDFG